MLAMASERANKITFKEFTAMNEDYPQVLYPAFRMQHSLQEITLGSSYWSSRKAMFRKERMQEVEEKIAKKKARKAAQAALGSFGPAPVLPGGMSGDSKKSVSKK